MDLTFSDTQASLTELARRIFTEHATPERLRELEAAGRHLDRDLWEALERAGLLGIGLEDGGFVEQCLVLVEQGRTTAPIPLWSHLLGSVVVQPGPKQDVTIALDEPGIDHPHAVGCRAERANGGWKLYGQKVGVQALDEAALMLVAAWATDERPTLFLVDTGEVTPEQEIPTTGVPEYTVRFEGTPSEPVAGDVEGLAHRAMVALCAIGVGVAERALELTASYVSEREQFGRPLGSLQAVQQRAADAYIDLEAMRWTMWQAAWRIDEGRPAADATNVAKFWAAEGGQRVVAAAQHLHGGIGVDVDYPLHRHTLWAKYVELALGGGIWHLSMLGRRIAEGDLL